MAPSDHESSSEDGFSGSDSGSERSPSPQPQSETQKLVDSLKPGYPSTALVNVLLQHYGIDFATYKRNVRTSAKLWNLWKTVYEAILTHVETVKAATTDPAWDSFNKYTEAIPAFEDYLLSLESPLAVNTTSAVPPKDEVSVLLIFMTNWIENRQKFLTTSKKLEEAHYTALFAQDQPFKVESEVKAALREDDKSVLQELVGKIADHTLKDDDILDRTPDDKFVATVKAKVQEISTAADNLSADDEERMAKIVFAVMGLLIPFFAHDHNNDNAHVISKEVWLAAQTFAEETLQFAKTPTIAISEFDQQWKTYEEVLKKTLQAFAMQMVTLMRHAAQVRRPFFGRTVGIVRMWQALCESSKLSGEEKASARKNLANLLQATEQEFTKTKTNVTSFIATTELDRAIEERKGAYKALVDKLKTEIQTYNPSMWDKVSQAYDNGARVDDDHLKRFRKFAEDNARAAKITATEVEN